MNKQPDKIDFVCSRTDTFEFRGRAFFVKRDDRVHPLLSGNKFRKLYTLLQTPAGRYRRVVSYGGTQSNAMLSIAALCHQKGWAFHYTSKSVPNHLKADLTGNLKLALELGMQLHEVTGDAYDAEVDALQFQAGGSTLFVPQGGADTMAQQGMQRLAQEIDDWRCTNGIDQLQIVTPSGTGTTAFYLAIALPDSAVLTTPAVGDKGYLMAQMSRLGEIPENLHILENSKKHHFAKPYPELLSIYKELNDVGIEFDLVYGALMWHTLFQHIDEIEGVILYIHSGGLMGNATMLERYRHKGLLTGSCLS